ncbi:class I SAM-dependent methyltransferase [Catellatospora sp. IY07-71]|uniref:class I SAM-dependent methyltransferase n=1 Tax=Catellatospora sp. IY07-71 TaxID=2728827 RepID=UPI001BB45E29|nr:class I SAM-dependent methyltransferase [Catellatospora sp. IY07-71]
MTETTARQRELNEASAGLWEGYAAHRRRVTGLVLRQAAGDRGRLVVLGAGNCNDLELNELATRFAEIHLVDLDGDALRAAVARQRADPAVVRLHPDTDVVDLPDAVSSALGAADVVVSATLLTQLLDTAVASGVPPDGLLRLRDHHLRTIAGLLRPGGAGLLITDVVSSDTCLDLPQVSPDRLGHLLERSIAAGDFFTGTNPFAIVRQLQADSRYGLRPVGVPSPWRWDVGRRSYLVCCVVTERRPHGRER